MNEQEIFCFKNRVNRLRELVTNAKNADNSFRMTYSALQNFKVWSSTGVRVRHDLLHEWVGEEILAGRENAPKVIECLWLLKAHRESTRVKEEAVRALRDYCYDVPIEGVQALLDPYAIERTVVEWIGQEALK